MRKVIFMFITVLLLLNIVGCSQAEESNNRSVGDYSEEHAASSYGYEEELGTLKDLKLSLSRDSDLDLNQVTFLIENVSDKEYRYSPDYFEIEALQAGTWYELNQLDDPSEGGETECIIKPDERRTLEIDIKSFYGELPAGHYRLIEQFSYFAHERDWDYDVYNLSCEFAIR